MDMPAAPGRHSADGRVGVAGTTWEPGVPVREPSTSCRTASLTQRKKTLLGELRKLSLVVMYL